MCFKRSSFGRREPYLEVEGAAANSLRDALTNQSLPEEEAVGTVHELHESDKRPNGIVYNNHKILRQF